ncbi:3-coathanger stack domain-containing protein [Emticicia soli]|uniref:3-coathanger stack domain-containing protein n=1 Tax=Emticicia soli TaxID=2027878 RepID=A0ABW5JE26_9BACT
MKKIILFVLYVSGFGWQAAMAQNFSPQVTASAGGYGGTGNLQVSWTLGETFIAPISAPTLSLSQGFQQNTNICLSIVDYRYVKAGNPYQGLFPLTNNMVIDQIPEQVSILVTDVCDNVNIESFEMNIQGPELNWNIIQNVTPNALFDNFQNNVNGRNFIPGNYTLTVTGYSEDNKGGVLTYGPVITKFTVVGNLATISMPTLSSASICAGSNVNVTFTTTGTFSPDNHFYVQLSQPSGSFEFPTVIGNSATAGTVVCTIPANAAESDKYLLRVVSSNQVYAGNPAMDMVSVSPVTKFLSSPTDDLSSGTKTQKVGSTLTASNKLEGATVNYQAGNAIVLNAGFEVKPGAVFKAEIKACN